MTTQEFKSIDRHIGERVSFSYTNLCTGKVETNQGIISKIYGEGIIIKNETQDIASIAHYRDVYFI
jgi:uncharacterized protein Veg